MVESNQCLSGHEQAVYHSRSHYTIGKELIDLEVIRREAEQCDRVEDFLVFQSQYGGTGSGLTSLFMERLSIEFSKTSKVAFSIAPSLNNMS